MILILILFILILFSKPIQAKTFSYQFNLANNVINLDFFRIINLPSQILSPVPIVSVLPIISPTIAPLLPKKILSFDYKIKETKNLPHDLPLFIVIFDQKVIFSVDASLADDAVHHVELNLELFDSSYIGKMPVFYQNNYLNDFEFTLDNLTFLSEFSNNKENSTQIENLNVIREEDQSLTIIFSLKEEIKNSDSYELYCSDENNQILSSTKLIKSDDFLWSLFSFYNFFSNQKNELIFHLNEFNCNKSLYVLSSSGIKSEQTSIINVGDL